MRDWRCWCNSAVAFSHSLSHSLCDIPSLIMQKYNCLKRHYVLFCPCFVSSCALCPLHIMDGWLTTMIAAWKGIRFGCLSVFLLFSPESIKAQLISKSQKSICREHSESETFFPQNRRTSETATMSGTHKRLSLIELSFFKDDPRVCALRDSCPLLALEQTLWIIALWTSPSVQPST